MDYADTEPLREFARLRGISPTKVYQWIDSGQIESYLDGQRRYIVVASYDRLVRRLVAAQDGTKLRSSNPKVRAREAAAVAPAPAPSPKPPRGKTAPPAKAGRRRRAS
jgi:hypothetical protein